MKTREADAASSSARLPRRCARREIAQFARAGKLNADLTGAEMQEYCRIDRQCRALLAQARARLQLSARGVHRVLRVARTIADLDDAAGHWNAPRMLTWPRRCNCGARSRRERPKKNGAPV